MKQLLLLTSIVFLFAACNDNKAIKDAATTTINPNIGKEEPAKNEAAQGGFVEENNMCICTKEYDPVCGSNGQTYPSPCQAKCEKITEFTKGACPNKES